MVVNSSYVVMEFCEGTELYKLISSYGALKEEKVLPLFRQMLSALYYCQMINVAHRDIKPENMVLTFDNKLKIVDFGLCSIAGKNISMSTLCYTLRGAAYLNYGVVGICVFH